MRYGAVKFPPVSHNLLLDTLNAALQLYIFDDGNIKQSCFIFLLLLQNISVSSYS
jgi:hypothetical protein